MRNIATLVARSTEQATQQQPAPRIASPLVRKLFVMLHGAYGNQFAGKFATGKVNADGEDLGTRAAMLVWDSALSRFAGDVVELAARRLVKDNPKFPFNLGELEAVCEAATPRQDFAQEQGLPRLAAPGLQPIAVTIEAQHDGCDWARKILARAKAGDRLVTRGVLEHARAALGLVSGRLSARDASDSSAEETRGSE
jgi:hypothetical protein